MKIKSNCMFIVLLLGVLIAGCSQIQAITPAKTATLAPTVLANDTSTLNVKPTATNIQTPTAEPGIFEGQIAIAGLSRQHTGVRLLSLSNGKIQDISGLGFGSINWSPDYQWIAYTGGVTQSSHSTAIYISKSDGSELQKYADSNFSKSDLSWSPARKLLVFTYESSELAILDLVSGETYLLTSTQGYESHPVWSPDGSQIAYLYIQHSGLPHELWLMNENGSDAKKLIDFPIAFTGIDWSLDGGWLAFVSGEKYNNCGDIYIVKPDGSNLTRLTNLAGCATQVTWSPDGKHLALVIRDIPNEMRCQIYIMEATGNNLIAIGDKEELRIEDIDWGLP